MTRERIDLLEQLAARAWPAVTVRRLDGWLWRFSSATARRANSVLPNGAGPLPLSASLDRVEELYAPTGRPVRYQISPAACPPDLDAILAERGYHLECPTFVQIAPLPAVHERLPGPFGQVALADQPDEAWLTAYGLAEGFSASEVRARQEILQRIAGRTVYALAWHEGAPVAVGLGVLEQNWLGIFCMATLPAERRRGHARAVLAGLVRWGLGAGAESAYLQVTQENEPALALYGRLGFTTLYSYHYRTKALPIEDRKRS